MHGELPSHGGMVFASNATYCNNYVSMRSSLFEADTVQRLSRFLWLASPVDSVATLLRNAEGRAALDAFIEQV